MTDLLVLSDDEVRSLLPLHELAEAVTRALVSLSEGNGSVPPRIGAHAPNGLLGAMPATSRESAWPPSWSASIPATRSGACRRTMP